MQRTSDNPIYTAWKNMRQRCYNKQHPSFINYGARGISVCERWNDFELFAADMGAKPFVDAQIDRVDNEGDYTPENCRWTSCNENSRNTRQTKLNVEQVKAIKRYLAERAYVSVRKSSIILGKMYNVSAGTVRGIALGRSWKEVN